jgi:hypothetical protein
VARVSNCPICYSQLLLKDVIASSGALVRGGCDDRGMEGWLSVLTPVFGWQEPNHFEDALFCLYSLLRHDPASVPVRLSSALACMKLWVECATAALIVDCVNARNERLMAPLDPVSHASTHSANRMISQKPSFPRGLDTEAYDLLSL